MSAAELMSLMDSLPKNRKRVPVKEEDGELVIGLSRLLLSFGRAVESRMARQAHTKARDDE